MTPRPRKLLPLALADVPDSLRRALAQEGVPTCDYHPATTATFVLFDGLKGTASLHFPEQRGIDVDELRRASAEDPFAALDDAATVRSRWQVGPCTASEETARVDKRRVRAAIVVWLRRKIESLGGVWMRKAPFPYPYHSAFNFRFDHDRFDADDFAAVCDAIAGREQATTHFVCAGTHERPASHLQRLAGCDVGSHGYRHHTYPTVEENVVNIRRGIKSLAACGLEPFGFAAPHGRYHVALAEAMRRLGIPFSSEFAAAFDDWPHRLRSDDPLQMPVHPVCLGIVLEAANRDAPHDPSAPGRAARDVADYFVSVAAAKRASGEPIFLYGHPDGRLGRYPFILTELFAAIESWSDVWQTSLREFARWWDFRASTTFSVEAAADGYDLQWAAPAGEFACVAEWFRGETWTVVPLDAPCIRLSRRPARFTSSPVAELPERLDFAPIGGVKERLRRALDWEYETPLDEIDARRWRGKLKRSLRRWKERTR